jgi:hypothetical protein
VPTGLTRIFDRDLAAAEIPKRDERDRVVDVHVLEEVAHGQEQSTDYQLPSWKT